MSITITTMRKIAIIIACCCLAAVIIISSMGILPLQLVIKKPDIKPGGDGGGSIGNTTQSGPPNIIVVLTDDQRYDTLKYMPYVGGVLAGKSIVFNNSFASTPYCCPARSSFLSGGLYSADTGVLSNSPPNGGASRFYDVSTIATDLQKNGYTTGLVGKYLNDYELIMPRIPPGWSYFATTTSVNKSYYQYTVVKGSSTFDAPSKGTVTKTTDGEYLTTLETNEANQFLDQAISTKQANSSASKPFFLYLAYDAPHAPSTPLDQDYVKFANFTFSSPGTKETDLTDKPIWVQRKQGIVDPDNANTPTEFTRDQIATLQPVDRAVSALVDRLSKANMLQNTWIFYTSDNGYMWGEHGLEGKLKPYEESIRIPMMVYAPNVKPGVRQEMVAFNLDIPATIDELAHLNRQTEGQSLLPLLGNDYSPNSVKWRDSLVFQQFGGVKNQPAGTWVAVRTEKWKYVEYVTGVKELYDMVKDPYELESQHNNPAYADLMNELSSKIDEHRGLTITTTVLPLAHRDTPYNVQLESWGGKGPYTWSVDGKLPDGLSLSKDGIISGIPTNDNGYGKEFFVVVTDSSTLPFSGRPQTYATSLAIQLK